MKALARSHRSPTLAALCMAGLGWVGASACGGDVIVDGAGASTTTGTTTMTGLQTPDGGSPQCAQMYHDVISELVSALGCTPTASVLQCSGAVLLHDACGCLYVANDAQPGVINTASASWQACLQDGCCGPQATVGCSPCPPPPTVGHCDSATSQCVSGP